MGISTARTKYGICFQRVIGETYGNHLIETVSQFDTVSLWLEQGFRSNFGFGRGQVARFDRIGETNSIVRAVAKRLVCRLAAAAQADGGASGQTERLTGGIDDFEIAFDADRAVAVDRNLG